MASVDPALEILFFSAIRYVGALEPKHVPQAMKLKLYSVYKQAKEGDCDTPKPGLMDFVAKAKWEAWKSEAGQSKAMCMDKYCKLVSEINPSWREEAFALELAAGAGQFEEEGEDEDWGEGDEEEGSDDDGGGGRGGGRGGEELSLGVIVSTMQQSTEGDVSAWGSSQAGFEAASRGNLTQLRALHLSQGPSACVEAVDPESGCIPLHFAADRGQVEAVQLLLQLGAHIDHRDEMGMTPLAYAVLSDQVEVVEVLVRAGADVDAKDDTGDTPRSAASSDVMKEALRLTLPTPPAAPAVGSTVAAEAGAAAVAVGGGGGGGGVGVGGQAEPPAVPCTERGAGIEAPAATAGGHGS